MVAMGLRQPGAWSHEARASPAIELAVAVQALSKSSRVSFVVAMGYPIWSESGRLSSVHTTLVAATTGGLIPEVDDGLMAVCSAVGRWWVRRETVEERGGRSGYVGKVFLGQG